MKVLITRSIPERYVEQLSALAEVEVYSDPCQLMH